MEITFLTGNKNKLREAKEILTYHNIQKEEIDLEEIQAVDSRDLIVAKLVLGYEKVKKPIMVEDTGLHFECLNGLPGALIKWFIKKIGVEGCWDLVKRYVDIFKAAGLTLLSLETENFALIRSLVGNDKSVIMLVDLGATTSSLSVVERGLPVLNRSLEMGGTMITRAISNSLNVNFDRAEQFKQDLSLGSETADNILPQTVEKSFLPILNEIKYTLNVYQEQNKRRVEKIILTGGSALLGNLAGYLSKLLNINTYIGDPWARVIFPTELKPILDRLGSRFAVAIGLAMRDIE